MKKIGDFSIPDYDIFKEWRPEQHFQRLDKYSCFLWDEGRLETWEEVIQRTVNTLRWLSKDKLDFYHYQKMFDMMYRLEVLPSMRLLSMPQRAIERCNTVLYNCTAGLGDTLLAIAEAQYLSMSGCGVTWSVEKKNIMKLPVVKPQTGMMYYHVVEDSQEGWAKATKRLLFELSMGNDLTLDYKHVRPYGSPLKTKGGYASGPQVLIDTHEFIKKTLLAAQGRKPNSLEMHDMFCYALESGVSGGVRRCLSEDTEILLKYDTITIGEIIVGDIVDTPLGYKRVTNVFKQGKQLVTKIILENDVAIEATENHRLSKASEWVYVKDITIDDELYYYDTHAIRYVKVKEIIRNYRAVGTYDIEVEDAHCFFANGILSHNSAGMCIFDATDESILTCKYDGFWSHPVHKVRANANNSAVWPETVSRKDVDELTHQLFSTASGEPGIIKRDTAVSTSPKWRKFIHSDHVLVNPCFVAGTMVQTRTGHYPIEDLVGAEVEIWNGDEWTKINNFRVTGENQPVKTITLHDGTEITATPYHKFLLEDGTSRELKDLTIGDKLQITNAPESHGTKKIKGAYLKGFLMGDGTSSSDKVIMRLYEPKWMCEDRLIDSAYEIEPGEARTGAITDVYFNEPYLSKASFRKDMTGLTVRSHELFRYVVREHGLPKELFEADYESKLAFIAGYFDADGMAQDSPTTGFRYQITSIHKRIMMDLQMLLKTIGVFSTVRMTRKAEVKNFNDGYPDYETQDLYRLNISQEGCIFLSAQTKFARLQSFADKKMKVIRKTQWNKITNISNSYIADKVYCCTVPLTNIFTLSCAICTMNCSETYLQPAPVDSEVIDGGGWQFCNLSAINARKGDSIAELMERTYYATLIGGIQSLATNFAFLRPGTKEICDHDRLLGVNLIGHATTPIIRNNPELITALREITVDTDLWFAKLFKVNRSGALTSVKPSGNHQVLCYTSPGGNPVHGVKQIRNVTVNKNSAMHHFLESQGVPRHNYPGRDYASMFSFPVEYPEDSITLDNIDALGQLEHWKYLKLNWCHHNPSVSVTYEAHEVEAIRQWLYENQNIIGGIAFFPKFESSYELLPIVVVNDEKYAEFTASFPKISWEYYRLYEKANDDRQGVAECAGGQCTIV